MNKHKRLLSLLLAVVMIVGMFPLTATAEDEQTTHIEGCSVDCADAGCACTCHQPAVVDDAPVVLCDICKTTEKNEDGSTKHAEDCETQKPEVLCEKCEATKAEDGTIVHAEDCETLKPAVLCDVCKTTETNEDGSTKHAEDCETLNQGTAPTDLEKTFAENLLAIDNLSDLLIEICKEENLDALMALTADEITTLRTRAEELYALIEDPTEQDEWDLDDLLATLEMLPNYLAENACPDCLLIGEHEDWCPRGQAKVLKELPATAASTTYTIGNGQYNNVPNGGFTVSSGTVTLKIANGMLLFDGPIKVIGGELIVEFDSNYTYDGGSHFKRNSGYTKGALIEVSGGTMKIKGRSATERFNISGACPFNLSNGTLTLTGSVDGNQVKTESSLLKVTKTGKVYLTYVALKDNYVKTYHGGAVTVGDNSENDNPQLTMDGCQITQCHAGGYGSALHLSTKDGGKVTLKNTTVEKCHGGDRDPNGTYGGTIRCVGNSRCDLILENCTVQDNYTIGGGGGIWWNSLMAKPLSIKNCTFKNNTATKAGGAIQCAGSMTIENTQILNNTTEENGGGIAINTWSADGGQDNFNGMTQDGTITLGNGVKINNNTAKGYGGGLAFNIGIVTANNQTYGKKADGTDYGMSLVIQNGAEIIGNTADEDGGGIYMNKKATSPYITNVTMSGGTVKENKVSDGGNGAAAYLTGNGENGEGIDFFMSGGTVSDHDTAFDGGAVYIANGKFRLSGGEIFNNIAKRNGGAIYLGGGSANIDGGTMKENTAVGGGAVYIGNGIFTMNNGTLTSNTATNGGAAYIGGGECNLYGGTMQSNIATGNGGAAYVKNTSVSFGEATADGKIIITKNSAANGAGLYIEQETGTNLTTKVANGVIKENVASGNGGGIYHTGSVGSCEITGIGELSSNTAKNGGAIYVDDGSALKVTGGIISNNKAVGKPASTVTTAYYDADNVGVGGGIYVGSGVNSFVSKFEMDQSDVARGKIVGIYSNLADFAADDVYANASVTKLQLPDVSNMVLGEGINATGWYEDYPYQDTRYADGTYENTNYALSNVIIRRYRDAISVNDNTYVVNVNDKANNGNQYVCLTIGITNQGFGTLKITKAGEDVQPDEVFLFEIRSSEMTNSNDDQEIVFQIAVKGTSTVTIMNVPYGKYQVTELKHWRYENLAHQTVLISAEDNTGELTFTNKREENKWLDGTAVPEVNVQGVPNTTGGGGNA